jgi:hypothetical protein
MRPYRFVLAFSLVLALASNSQAQWVRTSNGIKDGVQIRSLCTIGSNLFAGTNDKGTYRSTDNGLNWSLCNAFPADAGYCEYKLWTAFGYLFARPTCDDRGYFYRSTDLGNSWQFDTAGMAHATAPNVTFAHDTRIFAGFSNSVFVSSDSGGSWHKLSDGFPNLTDVISFAAVGSSVFAGTNNGLFVLSDANAWTPVPTTSTDVWLVASEFDSILYVSGNRGVTVSFNKGVSFSYASLSTHLLYSIPGVAFAASSNPNQGALISHDGLTWQPWNEGLKTALINAITVCDGYVFVGTSQGTGTYPSDWGIWRRPLSDFQNASVSNPQLTPSAKTYPNPTTGFVTISNSERVTLLNLLGVTLDAPQSVTVQGVTVDCSQLPAGMYFVKTNRNRELLRLDKE